MKSPMQLWREVTEELGDQCRVCTTLDIKTAEKRSTCEGISFFTITLLDFAKDFDEALGEGQVLTYHFAGFSRWQGLPRFLGGFLEQIFDRKSGFILDEPNVDAVFAVRQIARLMSKVSLKCSYKRERDALDGYVKTDAELATAGMAFDTDDLREFGRISRLLFGRILSDMDDLHATGKLLPRHGPGATADRLFGNRKFDLEEWHWRLERGGFHSVDYLLPNQRFWMSLDRVSFADPEDERPARVIAVPKTLRTPRIIAIEPTCMQYTQQAVAGSLVPLIEADSLVGSMVGFTNQEPNQRLARQGSIDGSLATLDLSEASDRVHNQLVEVMLTGFTNIRDAVQSSRSLRADVPGHGIIPLTKFASMGSALCFPIEAMVFTTLVFLGIQKRLGTRLTRDAIKQYRGSVRVYGDDIIVPAHYARSVSDVLEAFGLKVNQHKSFWSGNFRESCGKEYFRGYDVSVVKLRTIPPEVFPRWISPAKRKDVGQIVSYVSFRNQLYNAGLWRTAEKIDGDLERILKWFPYVGPDSALLGRLGPKISIDGINPNTHAPVAKGWVVKTTLPHSPVSGEGALLKWFLKESELPFADRDHLERAGRPWAVGMKLKKASPY